MSLQEWFKMKIMFKIVLSVSTALNFLSFPLIAMEKEEKKVSTVYKVQKASTVSLTKKEEDKEKQTGTSTSKEKTGDSTQYLAFGKKGAIVVSLKASIPDSLAGEKTEAFLKSTKLELVKTDGSTDPKSICKKDVGYSFPSISPWCLITAGYIKDKYESSGKRLSLGDWGCGHGFFSAYAMIVGADPYALESQRAAAEEANKYIFGAREYLPKGLDIRTLYKVVLGSVTKPSEKFMARENDVNVAFNVLHHLSPSDSDLLLKNMFKNTAQGGLVVLCCDTPFDSSIGVEYFNQSLQKKVTYPGFGLYNKSNIVFKDTGKKSTALLSVCRPTKKEIDSLKTGQIYMGSYPQNDLLDDTQTLFVDDPDDTQKGNILRHKAPYYYRNFYQLLNKFDFEALKEVVEASGFIVVNGWYTDHTLDTLYPHDSEIDTSICKKSKVVIVGYKK